MAEEAGSGGVPGHLRGEQISQRLRLRPLLVPTDQHQKEVVQAEGNQGQQPHESAGELLEQVTVRRHQSVGGEHVYGVAQDIQRQARHPTGRRA
ncbi:hypothetical protein GCM10025871_15160 [Deinococcus metallilatus]|nr:hypothetical protein GCM10025871_15160 [Deinococcus metallilatus]